MKSKEPKAAPQPTPVDPNAEIWSCLAEFDVVTLVEKGKKYGDSWKRRGGVGAFMVMIRMADRLEVGAAGRGYDIFAALDAEHGVQDGLLNAMGDLRRYLLLIEGEYRLRTGRVP